MSPNRIVVVGAGIIGASIGYHLVKRGAKVVILEAVRPGGETTEKSFGWINATFSKRPRAYFDLNQLGIAGWRRLEAEMGGEVKVQWGGSVQWCPEAWTPSAREAVAAMREDVRRHQEWGYATHLIEEHEFRRLLPNVAPGEFGAACYCEFEAAVDPVDAVKALLRQVRELGGQVRYPFQVAELKLERGQVAAVRGDDDSIDADIVVLASGVATERLAAMAGIKVPLKESQGVLVHTRPQPKLIDRVVLAPDIYCKQKPDGRVVVGGPVVAGLGTADIKTPEPSAESMEDGQQMLREAARVLPGIRGVAVERVTVGRRVMPVDEYPVVGFSDRCPNLYLAAMHSGITLAPLMGQLAATEILDGVRVSLLEAYRPSRFTG
ncbi:MAG: FAD-binding oxidoreductase [Bryobacterales bacterium]|nr:FAD-binding oxidoreductase [Bryobacterales bacterium]